MALQKPFPLQKSDITFGQEPMYRMIYSLIGEGVVGATDFQVTQRGAGANMSVDVAAGDAYVTFDSPFGGTRLVRNDATMNSGTPGSPGTSFVRTFTTADPTNPRIDRVVLKVRDSLLDAGGNYDATFDVIPGTATGGATLANLTGAAAVPSNCLLLANVKVGAAATQIQTADIDTGPSTAVRSRAQIGAGGAPTGGGLTWLQDSTLGADTATIAFSSIPNAYSHLLLMGYVRSDRGAANNDQLTLRCNGDTGANYNYSDPSAQNATLTANNGAAATSAQVCWIPAASAPSNAFAAFVMIIPHAMNVANHKTILTYGAHDNSGAASGQFVSLGHARWLNGTPAAISSLTLGVAAGSNLKSGSKVTLYGMT